MLPAPSIYPRFAANQLLTESSLNQMVDYFDGQVRDTRIYLNGLGIYYGLVLELKDEPDGKCSLIVQKGVGVSSEGVLFKLESDCTFKGYLNDVTILKEKLWKPGCPSEGFQEEYIVQELTEETSNDAENPALTKEILKDKVVMFLCEFDENNSSSGKERCFNELDEKGISKSTVLRMLLFDKNDIAKFAKSITGGSTGQNNSFPKLCIHRFGYSVEPFPAIRLAQIDGLSAYQNSYLNIFNNGVIDEIGNAYKKAGDIFFKLFDEDEGVFKDFKAKLLNFRNDIFQQNQSLFSLQYFYDYLKDLILAYEEFACLDTIQQTTLFPDTCDFPKYLLLGIPNPSIDPNGNPTATSKDFRTLLQRPPIEDIGAASVDEIRKLFDRMKKLANFNTNVFLPHKKLQTKTRITPSQGINRPLSEQAIPFYLKSEVMRPCWNPSLSNLGKANEVPSYNPASPEKPYDFPLLYDMNKYEFFRVEGFIGKSLGEAKQEIEQIREQWNIPFGIQCVQLNDGDDQPDQKKTSLEFDDMQRLYTKVRADIQCVAKNPNFVNGANLLEESFFPKLFKDFDLDTFEPIYNDAMDANDFVIDCNLEVLQEMTKENEELKENLEKMVWFHEFAQKHPGLEHLGGVYKGGTLVLVFVKSLNEQRDVVIADFCLPYNCCSDSPSVVFQIDEVRPRIIIGNEFCSNDSTKHEIIATPTGSVVTGPGVSKDGGTFFFTPSVAGVNFGGALEKTITLVSVFQDITVEKEITIQKAPEIKVKAEEKYSFDEACKLNGIEYTFSDEKNEAESGTYEWRYTNTNGDDIELSTEDSFSHFFPLGEAGTVRVIARRGNCQGNGKVKIKTCPDDITIAFEDGITSFVQGEPEPAKLVLSIPGGSFIITSNGNNIVPNIIVIPEENENCADKEYSLSVTDLPVGEYFLGYAVKGCGAIGQINFAITEAVAPPPIIEDETDGEVNPQMPRTRAARRPQAESTSKSSAKSSTKPKSKTKDTPTSKTTSKPVSKKAKPAPKKKTTTASSKKKVSPTKKETPPTKLENGARVMNLRRTAQQAILKKLEDENKLKGKSFGLGMSAFLFPGNDLERLNQRFDEAMKATLATVKRSKTDSKKSWIQFGETLLHNYLDKRVALTPTSLDDRTKDLLKTHIGKMKELKLNVKTMAKNWNGKELETALKATIINDIHALLK